MQTLRSFVALSPGAIHGEPWPPQFWRNSFVIGFVVKALAIISRVVTRGELTTDQPGHVLIGTLKDLGGYRSGLGEEVIALVQAGDPAFKAGLAGARQDLCRVLSGRYLQHGPQRRPSISSD